MFVPEIKKDDRCILVHNHNLETETAVSLAFRFTKARVASGRPHLPPGISRVDVYFDVRGQRVCEEAELVLTPAALNADAVIFFRG